MAISCIETFHRATSKGMLRLFESNIPGVSFIVEEELPFYSKYGPFLTIDVMTEVHRKYGYVVRFYKVNECDISFRGILMHRPNNDGSVYLAHSSNCMIPIKAEHGDIVCNSTAMVDSDLLVVTDPTLIKRIPIDTRLVTVSMMPN